MKSKKALIWGLLAVNVAVAPMSMWNFLHFLKEKTTPATVAIQNEDPAVSLSAQAFAEDFASNYFTWNLGYEQDRANRLKPFLIKGLDEQAGLDTRAMDVSLVPGKLRVWNVEKLGPNKSVVIVQADVFTKDKSKLIGQFKRHLAIPLEAVGNGRFVVSDIPYYVVPPSQPNIVKKDKNLPNRVEESTNKEIESYLKEFFKDYALGSDEKLSYFTKSRIKGFRGMMDFIKIEQLNVYKEGQGYVAIAQVQFEERETKGLYTYPYEIHLEKDGDRWYIITIQTK
jgi:hypothetical protein